MKKTDEEFWQQFSNGICLFEPRHSNRATAGLTLWLYHKRDKTTGIENSFKQPSIYVDARYDELLKGLERLKNG